MNNSNSIRINENESKENKKGVQIKINNLDLKEEEEVRKKKAKAFISNSFNIENKKYSFGAIIYYKNIKKNFSGIVDEAIYESMGTPGAQMYDCIKTIEEALKLKITDMDIFCSYNGVKKIANGNWDIQEEGTISFDKYLKEIREKINLNFIAYNGNETNDARFLAQKAKYT